MAAEEHPVRSETKPATQQHRGQGFLRLIAVYKFAKATLLLLTAWGILKFLNPEFGARLDLWVHSLNATFEQRQVRHLLDFVAHLSPVRLHLFSDIAAAYAALFLVEGYGLWRGRHWGEVLTVIATASLIPLEVFEILRSHTPAAIVALILNVAIVVYLAWRLKREAHSTAAARGA